jgi:hypothetical protein
MDSMRPVIEAFDSPSAFSESLEVIVDSAEWNIFFHTDLLRGFLALQYRTDQLISLNCIHGVASQYLGMGICDSGIDSLGADYISKTVKWQRLFSNIRIRKSVQYVSE